MGYYKGVSSMAKDIDLLVKNAKTYNEPGSQVFKVSQVCASAAHVTSVSSLSIYFYFFSSFKACKDIVEFL